MCGLHIMLKYTSKAFTVIMLLLYEQCTLMIE